MGKQVTPTLVSGQYKQSGNTQDGLSVVTAIETHGRDSRWKISGDVFQTMSAAAGTGGAMYLC